MNTSDLTLKQKAELVEKLTIEIINESTNDSFRNKSEKNKKIGGIIRVFGKDHYINYANQLNNFIQQTD